MERKGSFSKYLDHCRDKAIAQCGEMEALGFNMRALKGHVAQVDQAPVAQQMVDGMLNSQEIFKPTEEIVFKG